jgi:hypothetical protein
MVEAEELLPIDSPSGPRSDGQPQQRWLGLGGIVVAVVVLIGAISVLGRDPDPVATPLASTTTLLDVVPPPVLRSGPAGVVLDDGDSLFSECVYKSIADRIGGLLVQLCGEGGLIHLTAEGERRVITESGFYSIDTDFVQQPQEGVAMMSLGPPDARGATSTFVYFSESQTPFSVIMPGYTYISRGNDIFATVGFDGEDPDPGCLQIQARDSSLEIGCGPDEVEVSNVAVSPTDNRLALIATDTDGMVSVRVVGIGIESLIAEIGLDAAPINLDFDGQWLALAFETDAGIVTRLIDVDSYYSEEVSGLATFAKGPVTL